MQLTPTPLLGCALLAACATQQQISTPLVVEVWKQNDVGLTNRLFDELERKVRESTDFTLAKRGGAGAAQIVVTGHFDDAGFHTYRYHVNFMKGFPDAPAIIGSSTGTCRERQMARCAKKVLADARSQLAALR
jgi:hypothetical protein